ncbi:MAG: hypothetical protein ACRDZY_19135, partial [Acidimicrobiales bacterium]
MWRWSGKLALSPGLVELVSARIGRLPDAQRDVLEVLAFGEPLGIPLLVGLTDAVALEQVAAVPRMRRPRPTRSRAPSPMTSPPRSWPLSARCSIPCSAGLSRQRSAPPRCAHPRHSPTAAQLATWGLAASAAGLGRLDGLDEKVQWIDARADAFETGLYQAAIIGSSWVRGLLLAGLIDQADDAARRYRERCQDTPGLGEVFTSAMCGAVAQSRGQVRTAARWFRQSLAGSADRGTPAFTLLMDLPGALGMAGDATPARDARQQLTPFAPHPGFLFLEPDLLLAGAWVAAAEGGVSQATALARQAADVAATQHQPA